MAESTIPDYGFAHQGLGPNVMKIVSVIEAMGGDVGPGVRVLDIGCGNGGLLSRYARRGCTIVGIDPSESGIAQARIAHPGTRFEQAVASADLLDRLGEEPFDMVLSTEVVEHVYAPREWAKGAFAALKPGGTFVCSTPYHGYLKNLVLSLTDHWDAHHNPLWDGGHIKFWSPKTLGVLLDEQGFKDITWKGAGRAPYVWMSFVMRARRPG